MNPDADTDANSIVYDDLGRVRCHRCKVVLPRSRSNRKWCSPACAQAVRRARRKAEEA